MNTLGRQCTCSRWFRTGLTLNTKSRENAYKSTSFFFGIHHANLTNEARKRETIGFKSYKNPKYEEKN